MAHLMLCGPVLDNTMSFVPKSYMHNRLYIIKFHLIIFLMASKFYFYNTIYYIITK